MRDIDRRLAAIEARQPPKPRRVVIIGEHDPAPTDADFVIRLVAAEPQHGSPMLGECDA